MSNFKTKWIVAGLVFLVLLCGGAIIYWITPNHNTLTQVRPSSSTYTEASWAVLSVRWNGHNYVITSKAVPPQQIGKLIGTVTNSSDEETADESGTFSNVLPVGTKLYELVGVSSDKSIVVEQEKGHFVEASVQ